MNSRRLIKDSSFDGFSKHAAFTRLAPESSHVTGLPATWFYDHDELKAELRVIRKAFPNMSVGGLAKHVEPSDRAPGHRDPLMTTRFIDQFARALTYLTGYTAPARAPGAGHPISLHKANAKRLGAPVSQGALMCAHLALGGTARDLEGQLTCRAIRLQCSRVPMPVSAVRQKRH